MSEILGFTGRFGQEDPFLLESNKEKFESVFSIVLQGLGVDLEDFSVEKENWKNFLYWSIFDQGSIIELPGLEESLQVEVLEEGVSYDNSELPPVPVLTSNIAPLLIQKGWKPVLAFDISGLYGANSINHLAGDRLIRQVVQNAWGVLQRKDALLVRVGGDEFVGLAKEAVDKEKIWEEMMESLKDVGSYYAEEGRIVLRQAGVHRRDPEGGFINKKLGVASREGHIEGGDIKYRRTRLETTHPEVGVLLKSLEEEEKLGAMVGLLEQILYDPLFPDGVEMDERQIEVFKDAYDWFAHLQAYLQVNPEEVVWVVKIEYPGLLKRVNDDKDLGYSAGDRLIEALVLNMGQQERIISIYRQGGDFYLALSQNRVFKHFAREGEEGEIRFVYMNRDEEGNWMIKIILWSEVEEYKNRGGVLLPLISVFSGVQVSFGKGKIRIEDRIEDDDVGDIIQAADSLRAILSEKNTREFNEIILDFINKPSQFSRESFVYEIIRKYLGYLFNPGDKRGKNRLRQLGVSEEAYNKLYDLIITT